MNKLTRLDWERIADALSNFQHNPQYDATYKKVIAIIAKS